MIPMEEPDSPLAKALKWWLNVHPPRMLKPGTKFAGDWTRWQSCSLPTLHYYEFLLCSYPTDDTHLSNLRLSRCWINVWNQHCDDWHQINWANFNKTQALWVREISFLQTGWGAGCRLGYTSSENVGNNYWSNTVTWVSVCTSWKTNFSKLWRLIWSVMLHTALE